MIFVDHNGIDRKAEVVCQRDGNMLDLLVLEGADGDGASPYRITSVPFYKQKRLMPTLNAQGQTVWLEQDVEITSAWKDA